MNEQEIIRTAYREIHDQKISFRGMKELAGYHIEQADRILIWIKHQIDLAEKKDDQQFTKKILNDIREVIHNDIDWKHTAYHHLHAQIDKAIEILKKALDGLKNFNQE